PRASARSRSGRAIAASCGTAPWGGSPRARRAGVLAVTLASARPIGRGRTLYNGRGVNPVDAPDCPTHCRRVVTSQPGEIDGNPHTVRRMHASILRFSAVPFLFACNAKPITEGDPGIVRGVAIQHNVTERGIVDQPRDLSAATFGPEGRPGAGG